jgi:hypothetical protein
MPNYWWALIRSSNDFIWRHRLSKVSLCFNCLLVIWSCELWLILFGTCCDYFGKCMLQWWGILKCKLLVVLFWLVSYFGMQIVVTFYFWIVMFKKRKRLLVELCMFFIKRMKERNVCCCIYHVEIDELAVIYTTCIPNLGFILTRVTSLVKKIVNLQMKSPLNVSMPWPHTQF